MTMGWGSQKKLNLPTQNKINYVERENGDWSNLETPF